MESTENIEDVGGDNRGGQGLHAAHAYRILFAHESLDLRPIEIDDPVPLGRQLLIAAGLSASEDYSLFAILETGDFEDVRLDETFDLRGRCVERFVAFLTDRDFKLTVNDAQITWGKSTITGVVLYELAKPRENEAVFLSVRGGADRQIHPDETVDLSQPVGGFVNPTLNGGARSSKSLNNGTAADAGRRYESIQIGSERSLMSPRFGAGHRCRRINSITSSP